MAIFAAAHSGCTKHEKPAATGAAPATSAALRLSQRNEPATLDPHLAGLPDEFFIIRALSEGLLLPGPDGGPPLPGAAEGWTVSPDGLTYLFQLRSRAVWSNGDPVTAADFVYSIRRVLSPALAAPKAALFFPLRNAPAYYQGEEKDFARVGARALDEHHLELTLQTPLAEFPDIVASGPWIPVHGATLEKFGPIDQRESRWTLPENFVGNGPFVLTAWRPGEVITVRRSPSYHDAARVLLPEIRFVSFDNGETEDRAFRAGQLDVTMAVPFSKLASYRNDSPALLHTIPLYETRYLALNLNRPPLNDPRVRRALSLALDRSAWVDKILRGGQRPAFNFIPAGLGGFASVVRLREDVAEARRLLSDAGFPEGRGFPHLEFSSWTTSQALLEAIQQTWQRQLGLDISLVKREARAHLAALASGDFDIAMATAIPDYNGVPDLLDRFKTAAPGNYPHFSNPVFDRLVTEGGKLAAADTRNGAYQKAEVALLDDLPVIPLYFNSQNFLLRPGVKNWRTDPLWNRFYLDVSIP